MRSFADTSFGSLQAIPPSSYESNDVDQEQGRTGKGCYAARYYGLFDHIFHGTIPTHAVGDCCDPSKAIQPRRPCQHSIASWNDDYLLLNITSDTTWTRPSASKRLKTCISGDDTVHHRSVNPACITGSHQEQSRSFGKYIVMSYSYCVQKLTFIIASHHQAGSLSTSVISHAYLIAVVEARLLDNKMLIWADQEVVWAILPNYLLL